MTRLTEVQKKEIVRRYLSGEYGPALAADFKVSDVAIYYTLDAYDVPRHDRQPNQLPETQAEDIAVRYLEGESAAKLAAEYGLHRNSIYKILRVNGVPRRSRNLSVCSLNENVFDVVTPEGAYWIGFLMADGNIRYTSDHRQPQVSLALAGRDAEHVARFRAFLGSSHTLHVRKTGSVALEVRSRKLVDTLAQYGITPRKSLTAQVSELEDNIDFWRGVVDGDGNLRVDHGHRAIRLCGAQALMEQFAAFVHRHVSGGPWTVKPFRTIYTLDVTGPTAVALARLLYFPGAVALPRKLALAQVLSAA